MMAEISGIPGYLIIIFLLFAVFSSIWALVSLKGMKKKVAKAERKISILQEEKEETSEDLNHRIAALKKFTDETVNRLVAKLSEILEKVNTALKEGRKSASEEASRLIASKQASLEASMKASIGRTQDAINRNASDNRAEMQELSQKLESLSNDVQKMKIDLQERTIDLEL
jgi:chromosome segregation ATPase